MLIKSSHIYIFAIFECHFKVITSYIRRYEVITSRYNCTDALDFCNTQYNGLATVADDFEHLAMVRAMEESGVLVQLWIGGIHSGGDIHSGWNWKHKDGTLETIKWSKWTPGDPSGNGQCIQVRFDNLWDDSECLKNKSFICNA
ncbi:hypothetical protein DPMN_094655 [Dreissena polymorpha]|uniref:C-type lectin domain-containing protein n=1 Tax=Dreissena polymorpha TaxID=45954 RepID=A0A9D4L5W0_DREPO|nr:hypothetical protein DPMN_094655 [Dreissena polymorpha]